MTSSLMGAGKWVLDDPNVNSPQTSGVIKASDSTWNVRRRVNWNLVHVHVDTLNISCDGGETFTSSMSSRTSSSHPDVHIDDVDA